MMTKRQQKEKYTGKKTNSQNDDNDDDSKKMKDYLSNERTFLAWTRTGLTVFTLGCAIGKFGGSGNVSAGLSSPAAEKKPLIAGIILAIVGVLCIMYGIGRYFRTYRQIKRRRPSDRPDIIGPILSTIVLIGALIAVIIIFFIV